MSAKELYEARLRAESSFASFAAREPSTRTVLQAKAHAVMEKIAVQRAQRLAREAHQAIVAAPESSAPRAKRVASKVRAATRRRPKKITKAKRSAAKK